MMTAIVMTTTSESARPPCAYGHHPLTGNMWLTFTISTKTLCKSEPHIRVELSLSDLGVEHPYPETSLAGGAVTGGDVPNAL
jgi:hypothetical protein